MRELNNTAYHKEMCNKLHDIYIMKNNDYGRSFGQIRKEYPNAILIRLSDKLARLKALTTGTKQMVLDEKIEDTLMDLANYCLMELVEMSNDSKEDN